MTWTGKTVLSNRGQRINLAPHVQPAAGVPISAAVIGADGGRLTMVPVARGLYVAIPSHHARRRTARAKWVSEAVRMGVYYPDAYGALRERRQRPKVRYFLAPPQPEWVATALVMYQGIVQGVSWEAFKAIAMQARDALWPARTLRPRPKRSEVVLGLEWTYERPSLGTLKKLFIGLKRYEENYDSKRRKVRRIVNQILVPERRSRSRSKKSARKRRRVK